MTSDSVWQLVRYLLLIGFAPLAKNGYTDGDTINLMIGALGTLFTSGWGIWVKWHTKAVPAATAARADVPTVSPVTGVHETADTFRG